MVVIGNEKKMAIHHEGALPPDKFFLLVVPVRTAAVVKDQKQHIACAFSSSPIVVPAIYDQKIRIYAVHRSTERGHNRDQ